MDLFEYAAGDQFKQYHDTDDLKRSGCGHGTASYKQQGKKYENAERRPL